MVDDIVLRQPHIFERFSLQNKVALVTGGGKKDVILCSENNYSKTSI
jgi:hypothetical protein